MLYRGYAEDSEMELTVVEENTGLDEALQSFYHARAKTNNICWGAICSILVLMALEVIGAYWEVICTFLALVPIVLLVGAWIVLTMGVSLSSYAADACESYKDGTFYPFLAFTPAGFWAVSALFLGFQRNNLISFLDENNLGFLSLVCLLFYSQMGLLESLRKVTYKLSLEPTL